MSDLIDRQAAIDALDRIFDRCEEIEAHLPEGDPDRTGYKMYPDYMTVWKYLHQLPSAQPEPQWIPCSERLPEEKQDVLLLMPQNMVVGFWEDVLSDGDKVWYANSGNGYFTDMCFIYEYDAPIAWMPLPEPWKGE